MDIPLKFDGQIPKKDHDVTLWVSIGVEPCTCISSTAPPERPPLGRAGMRPVPAATAPTPPGVGILGGQCVACPACQANGTMRASLTALWRPACQAGRSSKHVGRLEPWRRDEPSPALIGESPDVWVISQSVTSRPKRRPRWETMMGAMSPRRIGFGESATAVCRMLSYGRGAPLLASSHPAASLLEINYIHGQSVIQVS